MLSDYATFINTRSCHLKAFINLVSINDTLFTFLRWLVPLLFAYSVIGLCSLFTFDYLALLVCLVFLRQLLSVALAVLELALYRPEWLWTQRYTCFCLLSAWIKGMCHHCPAIRHFVNQLIELLRTSNMYLFLFCVYGCFACMHACAPHVSLVPVVSRRGHQIS